ncbi:MAG: glutaredoxin family protein [Casimicrobiaceae bacterium]
MTRAFTTATLLTALAALSLASFAQAQDKEVYRYVDPDGRVVYTDRAPPPNAKNAQAKRVGGNYIETDKSSLAGEQAATRFPVTLYTFACGEVCDSAVGLLNRRGVPFSTVDVQTNDGGKKLQALTGELNAPVLSVGDKMVAKGYNEARWQSMLDDAGYPKTPPRRTAEVGRAPGAAPPPPPVSNDTRSAVVAPEPTPYPK